VTITERSDANDKAAAQFHARHAARAAAPALVDRLRAHGGLSDTAPDAPAPADMSAKIIERGAILDRDFVRAVALGQPAAVDWTAADWQAVTAYRRSEYARERAALATVKVPALKRTADPDETVYPEFVLHELFGGIVRASILHQTAPALASAAMVANGAEHAAHAAKIKAEYSRLLDHQGKIKADAYLAAAPSAPTIKCEAAPDLIHERVAEVMAMLCASVMTENAFAEIREEYSRRCARARANLTQHLGARNAHGQIDFPERYLPTMGSVFAGLGVPRGALMAWLADHGIVR